MYYIVRNNIKAKIMNKRKIKQNLKRAAGRVGEELLLLIKDVGELIDTIVFTPYGHLSISSMNVPRATYYSALRGLEKRGFIQKKKKGRKNVYTLTPAGIKKVNTKYEDLIRRDDGLSTVVLFDVPEEKSRHRTILRRYLIRNGYVLLQESVFISPYKITVELRDLLQQLGIRSYVTILSAKIDYSNW